MLVLATMKYNQELAHTTTHQPTQASKIPVQCLKLTKGTVGSKHLTIGCLENSITTSENHVRGYGITGSLV